MSVPNVLIRDDGNNHRQQNGDNGDNNRVVVVPPKHPSGAFENGMPRSRNYTVKMLTELKVVLWKNFIIRSRHWFLTAVEILVPILLFGLVAYGRSQITGLSRVVVNETTYNEVNSLDLLNTHFPVGEIRLFYTPYNSFTEKLMRKVQLKFQIENNDIREFSTEDLLMNHYAKNSNGTVAAVIFRGDSKKVLDYDIRMHEKYSTWQTERLFSMIEPAPGSASYIYRGFLALQMAVNVAFMELNGAPANVEFETQEFPYPPHRRDSGLNDIFLTFLPLITIFSFMFLCPMVLKRVVEEKYTGIKELMKMVGMKSWMLWLGWFVHALTSNVVSIAVIVFFMKVSLWDVEYPPIEYCSASILFVFLFLYCLAAIAFCFLIAALFNRPSIAMVIGIFAWILSYLVPRAIVSSYETLAWRYKILFGLLPNMGLHYGYAAIAVYETREVGVHWSNLFQPGSDSADDITMGNVFVVLMLDTVIFMLLTVYIDNVLPGQYGIPKHLFFPFSPLKKFVRNVMKQGSAQVETERVSLRNVEEGLGQKPCIQVKHLRKKYGPNVAVDNLNLDIYQKQITVLLGHNGAGKTTTMSIITGMISATSGAVEINGINIRDDMNDVRRNIGLCPQHNLLFTDLTVLEHLQFFGMLKGASCADAKREAEVMLGKLGISDKRNVMACTLSGGMKRRLCLGMAMMGDSSVLILDEPTSGMDPENRRKMWNMLLEYKKSKTILITTHFMEEADVLGDWIAIMAHGKLQCYGTSMYLKNKYATGYHLSVTLKSKDSANDVTNIITGEIQTAKLIRENEESLVFLLPLNYKHLYSNLFGKLNNDERIENMSLSITTLEDVFLKVKDDTSDSKDGGVDCTDGVQKIRALNKPNTNNLTKNFLHALLLKRFYFIKTKFFWYFPGVLVMIFVLLTTVYLGKKSNGFENDQGPALSLNLTSYGRTGVYFGGVNYPPENAITKMKNFYSGIVQSQGSDPFYVQDVSRAIAEKGRENIAYYKLHMVVAAEFIQENGKIIARAMYSPSALHGAPISINLIANAVIKTLLGPEYAIKTRNAPLQSVNAEVSPAEQSEVEVGMLWLLLVPIGLLFLMGNFIIFPNYELSTNFIQIQFLSGIKPLYYWLFNFAFDYLFVFVIELFVIMSAVAFGNVFYDTKVFGGDEFFAIIAIFACYAFGAIPFTYLFSYKKSIAGGFASLLMFGMFSGIVLTVIVSVLEMYEGHFFITGDTLKHVFLCLCPQFGLTYVSVKFSRRYVQNYNWIHMPSNKREHMCKMEPNPCCADSSSSACGTHQSYFYNKELGISADLVEMLVPFALYFALLLMSHTMRFKKCVELWYSKYDLARSVFSRQGDRQSSPECVDGNSNDRYTLETRKLRKSYGAKQAVKGINLKLKAKECFGLLGVNGAGKSTLFKMLANDIPRDEGEILIKDKDGKDVPDYEYSRTIGYCPQNDALNYAITGRQLMKVTAMMRGYDEQRAEEIAKYFIGALDLEKYADMQCLEYSGGNKRKLNMCLSFIGYPQLILLDEPTSGVDPASRRLFWSALQTIKKDQDATFVLCSHSMEECEVLCNRIAIMKDGMIAQDNIGTLAQLKKTYQNGFTVVFKLKQKSPENDDRDVVDESSTSSNAEAAEDQLDRVFLRDKSAEDRQKHEHHSGSVSYLVKDKNQRLSGLFEEAERLKNDFDFIEDYSISDTSLEDVFLKIANNGNLN